MATKRKACPTIRWEVRTKTVPDPDPKDTPYTEITIEGYGPDGTKLVRGSLSDDPRNLSLRHTFQKGKLTLWTEMTPEQKARLLTFSRRHIMVTWTKTTEGYRRCGYGTKLYEKMREIACDKGKKLASDAVRTEFAEGFWLKQVRKRRAQCIRDAAAWQAEEIAGSDCGQYAMRRACPAAGRASLAGRRKRKRRG